MVRIIDTVDLSEVMMIGDRVLIKPESHPNKTTSGLYLPPGISEKEKIHTGFVMKTGPGYPIPAVSDMDEPWMEKEEVKYVPIQPRPGDLAVYLQNAGYEIDIKLERYVIVSQSSILMLFRGEKIFE
ncbi:MAG: co-chaperone GroES family protein [Vicingaceae bacterium]